MWKRNPYFVKIGVIFVWGLLVTFSSSTKYLRKSAKGGGDLLFIIYYSVVDSVHGHLAPLFLGCV